MSLLRRKRILLTTTIATSLLLSSNAFAQSNLENLKDKKEQLQEGVADSQNHIKVYEAELDKVKNDIATLEQKMFDLSKKINQTDIDIKKTTTNITNTSKEIAEITHVIEEKTKDLESKKELLKKNLQTMYSHGEIQLLEFIFRANSISDFIFRYEFMKDIMNKGEDLHNQIISEINFIETQKKEFENKKHSLELQKNQLVTYKDNQVKQNLEQEAVQKKLEEKQEHVEHNIQEEEDEMKSLMSAIAEAERDIKVEQAKIAEAKRKAEEKRRQEEERRKREAEKAKQEGKEPIQYEDDNDTTSPSLGTGNLGYPLKKGSYYMSSPYGYRTHPITGVRTLHNGVDFAAPRNTPIYAMEEGYVLFSGPARGYGNWIVIKHPNGLYTIYGHMYSDGLYVSKGEYVFRGQKIGGVGSAGGSTGNHLHFCVATSFNGATFKYANPLNYL